MTTKQWNGTMFVIDSGEQGITQLNKMSKTIEERDYLLKQNNLSDIQNRNTARQNLGITVSALAPVAPKVNDLWVDLDS